MGMRSLRTFLSSRVCQNKVRKAKSLKFCLTSCQPPIESNGNGSAGSSLASSPQQSEGSHPQEKGQTTPDTEAAGEFSQPLPPWFYLASGLLPKVLLGLGLAPPRVFELRVRDVWIIDDSFISLFYKCMLITSCIPRHHAGKIHMLQVDLSAGSVLPRPLDLIRGSLVVFFPIQMMWD